MKDEFTKQKLRAVQYQHVDGGLELTMGGSFFLAAVAYLFINKAVLANSPLSGFLEWIPLIVFVLGAFLLDRLVNVLRTHITYLRTGYISPRRSPELPRSTRLIIRIGIPLIVLLTLAFLFLNRSTFPTQGGDVVSYLMPAFTGLLFSAIFIIIAWKIALPRFYLVALVSLLLSLGLVFRGMGGNPGLVLLFGTLGLVLLVTGGITLWNYLRRNQLSEESPDG